MRLDLLCSILRSTPLSTLHPTPPHPLPPLHPAPLQTHHVAPLEQRLVVGLAQNLEVVEARHDVGRRQRVRADKLAEARLCLAPDSLAVFENLDDAAVVAKVQGVVVPEHLRRALVAREDELYRAVAEVHVLRHVRRITPARALVFDALLVHHVGGAAGPAAELGAHAAVVLLEHLEDKLGVEKLWVDALGSLVAEADEEDLGRGVARRLGLESLDLAEKLLEDPEEGVVVLRAEDLGDLLGGDGRGEGVAGEGIRVVSRGARPGLRVLPTTHKDTVLPQVLSRQTECTKNELVLHVSVLGVGAANVGRAVANDTVRLLVLHLPLEDGAALLRRNVATVPLDKGRDAADLTDWQEVQADHLAAQRHVLDRDLAPSARSSAEVDAATRLLKEAVLLVDLDELESGTGTVPLLLRHEVVLVIAVMLLVLLSHLGRWGGGVVKWCKVGGEGD